MSQIDHEAKLSKTIAEAEEKLGWKLMSARPYVGVQHGAKDLTIGALLPLATDDDLQKWEDFFREDGWTKEEIAIEYPGGATAYVKQYATVQ